MKTGTKKKPGLNILRARRAHHTAAKWRRKPLSTARKGTTKAGACLQSVHARKPAHFLRPYSGDSERVLSEFGSVPLVSAADALEDLHRRGIESERLRPRRGLGLERLPVQSRR